MVPPVLAESIRLASLPGVAVPVRAVLTLDERRIDGPTRARLSQRRCHCGHRAENRPSGDLYHPPFLACLLHHGVGEALRRDFVGRLGTTTFAGPRWRDGLPVGVEIGDERPFLVELGFPRVRGKKRRIRREGRGSAGQSFGSDGRLCPDPRRIVDRSDVPHTPRRCGRAPISHSLAQGGKPRIEVGRPLPLGETDLANAAPKHSPLLICAVATGHGEISGSSFSMLGAVGIEAAEAREIIHETPPPLRS